MAEIPEHLLKRSQEARQRLTGDAAKPAAPAEEASSEPEAPPAPPAAETAQPAAAASGIPESLLARSQAARQKAAGGTDAGGSAAAAPAPISTATKAAAPAAAPAAAAPAAAAPAAAPAAAAPASAPASTATATAVRPAPAAVAAPARTQRLLAVVKAGSIQTIKKDPVDKVNTWPHLLVTEFVALLLVTAFLIVFSVMLNAPLQAQANSNLTPNPSKAPWYFLGLQELLTLFHPMVAGVTIPGIGIFALIVAPFIDRNPATKPSERKFAIAIFTFFMMYWVILVLLGSFFRGPGFNFVWPWAGGIFFDF